MWGVRIYPRLKDARDGSSNDAFPHTHFWASARTPVYEHLWWADGREAESGAGDTAGIEFRVRGVDGPAGYPGSSDWAWALQGDWDDADY